MKITPIISKEIKKLYLKNNSTSDIATFLNKKHKIRVCAETVNKHLRRNGVKIRENAEAIKLANRKHLPINKIIELYTKNQISARQIARLFRSTKTTIRKILEENNVQIRNEKERYELTRKYKRKSFNKNPYEKAYLIGLVKGDITPFKKSKYTLGLITNTTTHSFIELFKSAFSKYGHIRITPNKKIAYANQISIYLDLKDFNFLFSCKQSNEFLNNFSKEEFFYFISGLIDSDGSVMIKKSRKWIQYVIRIYNEDWKLLSEIKNKLLEFGVQSYIHLFGKKGEIRNYNGKIVVYNKNYFALEISSRKDVSLILKKLSIKHREKVDKAIRIREQIQEEKVMK